MNLPVANQPPPPAKPPASSRFQFATGDRPLSGYTIKRGVGRGGFGEVYFAVSDGGKEVALKLIRRNLDVELRGVQHCLNLKHPNLIALYDVRRDGDEDDCWIVMEYVAGESLEGAIRRHPNGMPADEAVDWLRGIAAGASYLHSHGIVHRDLKPGNVFRDESLVKLGDYGLSKFISCSRRSGQTESVGTVHYMAPEIAHGRYGREIDIYALGIILYEMLTGRVPFDGESVGEVLMKHLTAQPDVSAVPAPYRQVVARALAKDPAVRFATIDQLLAALPGTGRAQAAAPSPTAAAAPAAEPGFYHAGSSASRRVESSARQTANERAAIDPARFHPAAGDRQRRAERSEPWPVEFLVGMPPAVVWIIGAVLALFAFGLLGTIVSKGSGGPSSLALIGVALLGGWGARRWVNKRIRQRSSNRIGPTADISVSLPTVPFATAPTGTAPFATGGPPPLDPAAEPGEPTGGFPPLVAGIISAVFAGLVLPFFICFALDFASSFTDFAGPVRPIQDGIRAEGTRSKVLALLTLALIGGFASYSAAKREASGRFNRLADLLRPAFLVVGSLVLALFVRERLKHITGADMPPVGPWFTLAWVVYFLFKWRAHPRAGNQPGPMADVPPPLPGVRPEFDHGGSSAAALDPSRWRQPAAASFFGRLAGFFAVLLATLFAILTYTYMRGELHANRIMDVEFARMLAWVFAGLALYFLFRWRGRSSAGKQHGPTSDGARPLSPTATPTRSAFQSAAFAAGRAMRWATDQPTPALVAKSSRERAIELLESLLLSAAVAVVLAVIAAAWQGEDSGPEAGAWFALTGTLGAWGVLALSKLWERTNGEPILRRFAMLVVGMGLGAASFGFDRLLMVRLPFNQTMRPAQWHVSWSFYDLLDGAPRLEAFFVYFGLLFFLVPWWHQADPLRSSRVRIGSLVWTLTVAMLLHLVCPFPQPWGVIVAGIISFAVQLASPPAAKTNRPPAGGRHG